MSPTSESCGSSAMSAETSRPVTPVQRPTLSASPDLSARAENRSPHSDNSKLISPPSLLSSNMTPPPSAQIPGAPLRPSRSRSSSYLAPSPDIQETLYAAYGASDNLPTNDEIETADEGKLRAIAKELLAVAREARISALHFKLQYGLLSFRSNVAIKRAEVEHKLARREAEILQSVEYRSRHSVPDTEPTPSPSSVELELAVKRNQELERVNATLDRRLRRAKKLIEQEQDRLDQLTEENQLLKKRIRENRKHFSRMIEHGAMSPAAPPQGGLDSGDNSHPFAALLAADRVLNREPSVSFTPHKCHGQQSNGHVRGSHSLSSLPITPSEEGRKRGQYITPGKESSDENRDRDSTISASDAEEAETEEDIPLSQAPSLATSMLRCKHPAIQQDMRGAVKPAPKSSTLLQTKLFGQVRKPGVERPADHHKRKASFDGASSKKPRVEGHVGLGIH
ncbi:hypothetical protein BDW66DRAFT_50319 [Aspergillus desertorum]